MKGVEQAAREMERIHIVDLVCDWKSGSNELCQIGEIRTALATLDAIRKGPGNGKTGEAKL